MKIPSGGGGGGGRGYVCWYKNLYTDDVEDFTDCLDRNYTKVLVVSGDWNEDLNNNTKTSRQQSLKDFISENDFTTKETRKTYMNPRGTET